MTVAMLTGDCRERLAELPAESVHCCVTSPPYFNLRDYEVEGQLGREESPAEYVAALVEVFRLVRAALRSDGVLWLNLGDSYANDGGKQLTPHMGKHFRSRKRGKEVICRSKRMRGGPGNRWGGGNAQACGEIKPKDLIGIPWMVAFALRAEGWYLRSDVIWSKPNPMPESVQDRPTKAHEYLFLLTKSERYFFDAAAVREPFATDPKENCPARAKITGRGTQGAAAARGNDRSKSGGFPPKVDKQGESAKAMDTGRAHRVAGFNERWDASEAEGTLNAGRNIRSVWTIPTQPYPGAHFATFPPALIEPCILAGCPRGGVVLDPFGGAGTTGLVADRLGRDAILIELNPEYVDMARRRIANDAGMFAEVAAP